MFGFLRPAWRSSDAKKRERSVAQIADVKLLERIIRSEKNNDVRRAIEKKIEQLQLESLEGITDPIALMRIACGEVCETVSIEAVKRITDPVQLLTVCRSHTCHGAKEESVKRISDPKTLAEVALNHQEAQIRAVAIDRIEDEAVLMRLFKEDPDLNNKLKVLNKLKDQKFIIEIVHSSAHAYVKQKAVEALLDQEALTSIAFSESFEPQVRLAAIKRIYEPASIERLKGLSSYLEVETRARDLDEFPKFIRDNWMEYEKKRASRFNQYAREVAEIGESAIDSLLLILRGSKYDTRHEVWAIYTLSLIGGRQALKTLVPYATGGGPFDRIDAAREACVRISRVSCWAYFPDWWEKNKGSD